jgi:hypothetical protein
LLKSRGLVYAPVVSDPPLMAASGIDDSQYREPNTVLTSDI